MNKSTNQITFLFLSCTLLLLIEVVLWFTVRTKEAVVFPSDSYSTILYSDKSQGLGNSAIDTIDGSKSMKVRYTLSESYKWPFAGMQFRPTSPLDLNTFDTLQLNIEVSEEQRQIVALWSDFNLNDNEYKEHPQHFELHLKPGTSLYTIPLNEFKTPPWWLIQQKLSQSDIPSAHRKRTSAIGIRSGYAPQINKEYTFEIQGIALHANNREALNLMLSVGFIWALLTITFILWKNRVKAPVLVPLKELLAKDNQSMEKVTIVISTIGNEFDNPNLSLGRVAQLCLMQETEISQTIKEAFNLSFKQYLNRVRMEHAKDLLENSQLTVKEVCFKSGYKTTSHFFRLFRSYFKISPNEFRNQLPKSPSEN